MHRFTPPQAPAGFADAVKKHVASVKKAVAKGRAPKFEERVWKKFAPQVAAATHGKCGFCEIIASAGSDADVEHFYPKSEVAFLSDDPKDWGEEMSEFLARIKGRKPKRICRRGYHWRAYDFANYLFSCHLCNRKYKLTIFPVLNAANRKLPPDESSQETPLLLSPFFGPDPVEHLAFNEFGAVEPYNNSLYGHETIKTCGLNRKRLQGSREEKAWDIHEAIKQFRAESNAGEQRKILRRIQRWGNEKYAHCGMVRAVFAQEIGMAWSELERRLAGV